MIEIKYTMNLMLVSHPPTRLLKNCFPQNQSLEPKGLGTAALRYLGQGDGCNFCHLGETQVAGPF